MLSIAILYASDTAAIVESLCSEVVKDKEEWLIKRYPIINNRESKNVWMEVKTGRLKENIIVFVFSKQFSKDNEEILKKLRNTNNGQYKFVGIMSRSCDKSEVPQMKLSLDFECSIEDDDFSGNKKCIETLKATFALMEISIKNNREIRKSKRERMRYSVSLVMVAYVVCMLIILGAVVTIQSNDISEWARSSSEFMTIILSAILVVVSSTFVPIRLKNIQKNKEKEQVKADQKAFGDDLDVSLSSFGEDIYLPIGHLKVNWKQMKGYYDIGQQQGSRSFTYAIGFSITGIVIFIGAILSPLIPVFSDKSLVLIVGAIAGAIVELFAGTILIVYKQSLSQMNLYHKALSEYQKYLSCINLVSMISDKVKRDQLYEQIIKLEMNNEKADNKSNDK